MAFKIQEQKLIPGGLNLLAPGDAVTAGDCIDLTGWWAGAAGRLEQAPTYSVIIASAPGSDSLCQSDGRLYYGGGGQLWQQGRVGGPIDTGFDGNPLGMISYQGFCWIMNQAAGKQRKDNGANITDWTPAAPDLPTLTNPALPSPTLTVVECDPGNPDSAGTFQQIKMWTSSSVAGIEIGALVTIAGNGTAAMNATWVVTDIFPGTPNNLIYLTANLPAGTVFGMGGTFTFGNPGMPPGDYQYWITWQYTELGESNPSSAGSPRIVTAATITVPAAATYVKVDAGALIAALPAGSGVSGWNIYRQGNGLPSPYRLNENVLPLNRTFVYDYGDDFHTHSDAQLLSLGIIMQADHDPAPPCKVIAQQVYNGRLVVANSIANPNRIWYTPALQPGFFRGSGNPNDGDWVDIGTDRGDEILAITVRPGILVVYRSKSIWRLVGDFGDAGSRIEPVVPDMGTVGLRSVVSTSLGDYYIWNDGVYKFNNDWGQKISSKVEPLFRGLGVEALTTLGTGYRSRCAIGFKNGRLWVSYPSQAGENGDSLIYHVDSQRWFSDGTGYRAFLDSGANFIGAGDQIVYLENIYPRDATSILSYQSEYQDCGLPDHEKTFADLVVQHNTRAATLTVEIRTDKFADVFTLGVISSTILTKQIIPLIYPDAHPKAGLPIRAYNLSVHIWGNGADGSPVIIDTPILLHYYLESRRAKAFDSDETSHGVQGVKEVDQVEFDVDATDGPATLHVYSDIPGGAMVERTAGGVAIAQTTGRQVRRLVLGIPADGNLLRYTVGTLTDVQIYAARARVLPIGVYLDGSVGDFWQPVPISIGV